MHSWYKKNFKNIKLKAIALKKTKNLRVSKFFLRKKYCNKISNYHYSTLKQFYNLSMHSEDLLNHITHRDETQTNLLLANLVKVHIKKPFIPLFLQLAQKNFKFFTNYSIDYLGILNHTPSLFQRDLTNYL